MRGGVDGVFQGAASLTNKVDNIQRVYLLLKFMVFIPSADPTSPHRIWPEGPVDFMLISLESNNMLVKIT